VFHKKVIGSIKELSNNNKVNFNCHEEVAIYMTIYYLSEDNIIIQVRFSLVQLLFDSAIGK